MQKIEIPGFKISKKIGEGSFGEVFRATNLESGISVAIKVEKADSKIMFLEFESKIYKYLMKRPNYRERGIPRMYEFGKTSSSYYLVIELLGKSLESLHEKGVNQKLGVYNSLIAAKQMLDILEFMHDNDIIHRDVKPDNFVVGSQEENYKVFALDFGLSKKFIDSSGNHIPFREDKDIMGTLRYASIHTHKGQELSRRDDLESLAYNMVYLAKGALPWMNLKGTNQKQLVEEIYKSKVKSSANDIAKGLPVIFSEFIDYTRNLQFEERPQYSKWKNTISKTIEKEFKIPIEQAYFEWVKYKPRDRMAPENQELDDIENEIKKFIQKPVKTKEETKFNNILYEEEVKKSDDIINKTLKIPKNIAPKKVKPRILEKPKEDNFKEKLKKAEASVFIPRIIVHKNLNR